MNPPIASSEDSVTDARPAKRDDDNLVAAAQSGHSAAIEALLLRNKRLVLAITRRMTGSFDEAEDVAQQALMKAFANLSRFAGRSSFSTWLVSIAMNEARMWKRKAHRSREVSLTDLCHTETFELPPPEFMDRRPNPEITCSQSEARRLLYSEMERLPPGTREAIKLCDIEGHSSMAAAVRLGITVSSVKSRRLRGRVALRQRLEPSFSFERRHAGIGVGTGGAKSTQQPHSRRTRTESKPAGMPHPAGI